MVTNVKSNSTFLYIVKWIVVIFLLVYIWQSVHENSTKEHYDNTRFIPTPPHTSVNLGPLNTSKEINNSNECRECTGTSVTGGKLLPIMDPCFNMREVCKQCILLEDHLNSEGKDCVDCCQKHFLTIEALCEEAVSLDKEGKYPEIRELPDYIRQLIKSFIAKKNKFEIAQKLRVLRKKFMKQNFSAF